MKMTLALFSVLISALGTSALASESVPAVKVHTHTEFALDGMSNPGTQIFYSCDSAVYSTETILKTLGASNIDVLCTGGLDNGPVYFSPYVSVSFDAIRLPTHGITGSPAQANWARVSIHGNSGCDLAQEVLSNVRDHLEVQGLDGTMTCMDPEMAYDFELSVLKEI